jgi:GNAT superfamily N-acetyltransferase
MTSSRARVLRHVTRHGPVKTFHKLVSQVRPFVYLHETHVWSTLDLAEPRPRLPLPEGFEMFRAGSAEVSLVGPLEVDVEQSHRRLAEGAELWLMRHGTEIAYSGWIFHGHAPTIAAPGGAVRLPLGTVNPEDMVTAPRYRGRGLASAGYSLLFDDLERTGRATRIVGKVPEDNTANRRALVKSGWQEFAIVDFRRLGPCRRSRVRPIADVGDESSAVTKEMMRWLKSAIIVGRPRHSPTSG